MHACESGTSEQPLRIVITGVTSGLGNGLAREFKSMGHTVIGCGRREERLDALRESFGPPHEFHRCDVTSETSVIALASRVGHCDILINNAGSFSTKPAAPWEADGEEFRAIVDVNLNGTFYMTKHIGAKLVEEALREKRAGSPVAAPRKMVNISSGAGHSILAPQSAYCASKWAVEALSRSTALAINEAGLGDHLICVPLAPGAVASEMNTQPGAHPLDAWAPVAARVILGLGTVDSGRSVSLTQFYDPQFVDSWLLPPTMGLRPECESVE